MSRLDWTIRRYLLDTGKLPLVHHHSIGNGDQEPPIPLIPDKPRNNVALHRVSPNGLVGPEQLAALA
ncbi:MAG: hypothetical protein L0Z62_25980 [Gemmataceae bacterium]|nr:hypothetical protein [Gemmataceae bacterium]